MCVCVCAFSRFSHVRLWDSRGLQSARFLCPWDFPGENTRVCCHAFHQGVFPIQGSNPCLLHLLHCRQMLYEWATGEAPSSVSMWICILPNFSYSVKLSVHTVSSQIVSEQNKIISAAANGILEMAWISFSPLPINHNSPRILLSMSTQSISLERRICIRQEALASSCSYHKKCKGTPKDLWPFLQGRGCLRGLSLLRRSHQPPFPGPSPAPAQAHLWSPRVGRDESPPQALITGLPDCNYRLLLPSYPNDSHTRDWNSLVRWNQLLGKIGRLIFPRMRCAF